MAQHHTRLHPHRGPYSSQGVFQGEERGLRQERGAKGLAVRRGGAQNHLLWRAEAEREEGVDCEFVAGESEEEGECQSTACLH